MDAPGSVKPLVHIGAIIRRAGASLWSAIRGAAQALRAHSGLRVALLSGTLLALVISFAETLRERFDAVVTALQIDDREGIILIDTPQLYTRERLVNDRFREAAWLQERLNGTDDLVNSGRFRQPQALLRREHRASFSVGATDDASPPSNDGNPGSSASQGPAVTNFDGFPPSVATEPTPLDELDDIARYREAIRNAFMATQLDDRHDIAGNTIYRLNFEAIVVPEQGARKLAAIKVALGGPRPEEHLTYYLELLEDWRDELQRQVIDLVDDRVETIERGFYLPPAEQARFGEFLDNRIKDEQARITTAELMQFVGRYLDRQDQSINQYYKGFFNGSLDPQHLAVLRHQLCTLFPELVPADLPDFFPKVDHATRIRCQEMRPNTPLLAQIDLIAILDTFRDELDELWRQCSSETIEIVDVLERLIFGPFQYDAPRSQCVDDGLGRLRTLRRQLGEAALRQAVVSAFIAADLRERQAKTEINAKRPVLGEFFNFKIDHCEVNRCYPEVVLEKTEASTRPSQADRGCDSEAYRSELPQYLPCRVFAYLEDDAQVATYTVTPGKAEQGLALLERQALALSAQDTNFGFWSASGLSAVEAAALKREPLILSIGDWGKRSDANPEGKAAEGTTTEGKVTEEEATEGKVTKFAWIVLPRREASRLGRAAQRPDHVSVSAVVSVPSWWKSIRLDIATCWLQPDSLPEMIGPDDLCEAGPPADPKQYTLDVAVPGDASEVMSKLRFEVLTFPHVFRQQPTQVLEVGRPGTLTVLGGRLWRSPTVVMGTEVANRIEVLPDMRGILAHFECIHPYPGTRGTSNLSPAASRARPAKLDQPDTRVANAVIWTSEGKTQPISVELRPFARRAGEETDHPCWLDVDNGKRHGVSAPTLTP